MQTVTYSTVGTLPIKVDFQAPPSARGVLPGVVFFHGGGMVAGSRREYGEWIVGQSHYILATLLEEPVITEAALTSRVCAR